MKKLSTNMMECLNQMIENYGVPYYGGNDCFPEFKKIEESDPNNSHSLNIAVQDYFCYYKLNYDKLSETDKHKIANHFWDDYRTFFGREYDRIVCTNSFRRLQYKTQVMVNSASDEQRTRLLHSLEVQRIAKKIALGIGANAELAENIAIAHDIGHAPFGHSGEEAISKFLAQKQPIDKDAHFLHAIQSVKVLDKIATHTYLQKYKIEGLGLSDYVLEGVLKHDSDVFAENIISSHVKNQYDVKRLCGIVGIDNYNVYINKYLSNKTNTIFPQVLIGSVESQIVAWADKIAYLGHDWEEFLDTKLLEKLMSRLNDMVREIFTICSTEQQITEYLDESNHLKSIKEGLQKIEKEYSTENPDHNKIWSNSIKDTLIGIIKDISNIEEIICGTYFFTLKEYRALKDYFAMVLSWAQLTNSYPKPYAMKYDPIYIFYIYLNEIRTTTITSAVTDQLIYGTNKTLNYCSNVKQLETRADFLGYCNSKWIKMYQYIYNTVPDDKRKKFIKNNVRDCFLVRFTRTKNIDGHMDPINYDEISPIITEEYNYYSFHDTYCCLLNIIGCIHSQYICSTRVSFMTQQAKKIVSGLMQYYVEHPEMLPYSQRKRYKKDLKDNNDGLLYFIADYVSGMTDRMAKKKYDEIFFSDTKWSNEYSSGLN